MKSDYVAYEGFVKGPKWARLRNLLYKLAYDDDLKVRIRSTERGWEAERINYEIAGDQEKVNNFKLRLDKEVANYNDKNNE